jgi:hypothetical protein
LGIVIVLWSSYLRLTVHSFFLRLIQKTQVSILDFYQLFGEFERSHHFFQQSRKTDTNITLAFKSPIKSPKLLPVETDPEYGQCFFWRLVQKTQVSLP